MRSALRMNAPLPKQDKQAHCVATGVIARHCSITEAWLAGVGKELADVLGPGDAEWGDLIADGSGIRCARESGDAAGLKACCERAELSPASDVAQP